ncbi:MAG TPA: FCD domain-containing protein [Candidatus Angelobacter sp.]|jgi:GntR family transcriptional repressor for pyruvate dehydrogenase complex|nr:FCD domain-containing protein [Candidatus Angelobacter sp.]
MSRLAHLATPSKRSEKKSEGLARRILHDVVSRRLRPGTMLAPEAVMLDEYEVGRTTLREALRILEVQGVLSIRPGPGGGPVVAEAGSRSYARTSSLFFQAGGVRLVDVMEARAEMEPVMARLAAENRDQRTAEALQRAVAQVEAGATASAAQFREACRVFLEAVAGAAGQPVLSLFCRALDEVVSERMARFSLPVDKRGEAVAQLAAIGRAIVRGNGAAAERLMRAHIRDHNRSATQGRSGGVRSVISWG